MLKGTYVELKKREQGVKEQFQAFKYISIIMFNNEADDAKRKSSFSQRCVSWIKWPWSEMKKDKLLKGTKNEIC